MSDNPTKAAFGIYPSSGKRPERLNQSRDVNIPLQLARGWTAGLLGLPGDIEGLGRMLVNLAPAGQEHERVTGQSFVDETPVLPTSDFYREWLPGYDKKPFAKAVSGLGALSGGYGATKVAGRVAEAAKPENIRQYVRQTQGLTGMPGTAVTKSKGGDWLPGNIEKSTEPLKRQGVAVMPLNETELADFTRQGYTEFNPSSGTYSKPDPVNTWIDKKLNKYIRNEMGTPEDPVRKLAEQGRLHFEAPYVEPTSKVDENRRLFAQNNNNKWGYGQSQLAQNWEDAADRMLNVVSAESLQSMNPATFNRNWPGMEWVQKLNPETPIYGLNRGVTGAAGRDPSIESLGFPHLIDELRNAVAPNSDLPAHLRWKPEDLDKVTMAQAVERVSKINDWRAAQMEAAKKAAREGIPVHKQYEGGYQWMAAPDTAKDPKSLKYIQDVGCESGWCTQGESLAKQYGGGGNQLYVLHDPDGKSVVQISVRPMDDSTFQRQVDWKQYSALQDISQSEADKWLAQQRQSMPSEIVEIKGRQNRAPKDEYLPMVQDFVRSGKWSRVGDLDNTGLFQVGNKYFNQSEIKSMTEPAIRFLEEAPMLNRHRQAMQTYRNFKGPIPSPEFDALNREIDKIVDPSIPYTYSELVGILHEPKAYGIDSLGKVLEAVERLKAMSGQGYAAGGLVQTTDTLRDKLIAAGMDPEQAMQQALRMADQVEMQAGGLASKTLKGAFRGAEKAIPRIETKGFQEFRADAPFIRAEEASKHQFETGKPVIVESYTGTRRDFSEIDPGLSSAGYFSSNKPIVANEYAGVFPEGAVSQPFPTGGNIQKSFIRMDNPLFINARGASFNRVDTRGLPGFGLPMSNTDMINLWAKQQGYDGVVYKDLRDSMALPSGQNAPASNVYVSFKPNYVKSAIGNRGTYDVKERDMTKAEGGVL